MVKSTLPDEAPSPLLRRLRLAQLQLVRMAGDGANFRSMAQALRVTQPAITKMAHELEHTLGARVFERGSGGMRLTDPFGHSVLAHARRALAALDQLADDLPHYRDAGTPALRIGSPAFTAAVLLGAPVAQWLRRTPGARVLMSDGVSAQLLAALKAGELDCVVGSLDDGSAGDDKDLAALHFEALYDDHVTFVTHAQTPGLARLTRLGQLQALPWVLPPRASQVWTALRREFTAGGHPLPLGVVETSSIPAIGAILSQAPGVVGALRADAGRYLVRNFGLKSLRISPRIALPRVGIVRLRTAESSPPLEALLALVRAQVKAMFVTDDGPAGTTSHGSGGVSCHTRHREQQAHSTVARAARCRLACGPDRPHRRRRARRRDPGRAPHRRGPAPGPPRPAGQEGAARQRRGPQTRSAGGGAVAVGLGALRHRAAAPAEGPEASHGRRRLSGAAALQALRRADCTTDRATDSACCT